MLWSSLKSGFAQVRANQRLLWVFYLANLFFGLLLLLPLRAVLQNFIGDSTLGTRLGGNLDMDFFFEFLKYHDDAGAMIMTLILIVPAANWLFTLFLSGGAFAVFANGDKYEAAFFWGNAAKYFGRFLRLVLWSLPIFALLFCVQFLETGLQRLFWGKDPYQNITYWGAWTKVGLRALSFLIFGMILDYSRIHAVLTGEKTTRISLRHGLNFVFGNFLQTFGLGLLLLAFGAGVLLIYNPLADSLNAPNGLIVFMLFLAQQLYMVVRTLLRLTLYASELHLYRQLAPTPAPALITTPENSGTEGFAPAVS